MCKPIARTLILKTIDMKSQNVTIYVELNQEAKRELNEMADDLFTLIPDIADLRGYLTNNFHYRFCHFYETICHEFNHSINVSNRLNIFFITQVIVENRNFIEELNECNRIAAQLLREKLKIINIHFLNYQMAVTEAAS